MNRIAISLLTALSLITGSAAYAASPWSDVNIDLEDLGPQDIAEDNQGPLNIQLLGDFVGKSKVRCPGDHHLIFATAQVDANLVYYYNPCYKEGLTVGASYMWTRLDWKYNPYFTQKDYYTASVNLGFFSQRLPCWTWRAQVSANFDNVYYWDFRDYMNYDLLLWGRYDLCSTIGVHIGFIGLTGMRIDRVYPIIGFDWTWSPDWKLSVVFPVDISLTYSLSQCWSTAIATRFFNQRHRVKENQFLEKGLWFYTTGGIEYAVNWQPTSTIKANLHAGYNLGGHLKVANRHYRHGHRMRIDGAPYGGAEIDVNF